MGFVGRSVLSRVPYALLRRRLLLLRCASFETWMYAGMYYCEQSLFFVCLLARYISNWSFYDIEFARCKRNNVKRVYLGFLAIR